MKLWKHFMSCIDEKYFFSRSPFRSLLFVICTTGLIYSLYVLGSLFSTGKHISFALRHMWPNAVILLIGIWLAVLQTHRAVQVWMEKEQTGDLRTNPAVERLLTILAKALLVELAFSYGLALEHFSN